MSAESVQYVTSSTTVSFGNTVFILDGTSAGFTFTLPDISGADGSHYYIKREDNVSGHTITIQGYNSSQLIDAVASRVLHQGDANTYFVSYNGNWYRY